ncbi:MAG: lamin tail domain-containing protein [Anaerolineales bacterium]|nr:MAG: lamin tail domain-containing protein [Anaerolineales bacterium]
MRVGAIIVLMRDLLSDPRLVRYLLLNVAVSIVTALIVMSVWTYFVFRETPAVLETTGLGAQAAPSQLQVTTVVAAGDLQNERVTIEHIGQQEVALAGWRLRDGNGIEFRFPALVLHPGGQVSVYTREGDDTAAELYWDRQVAVWSRGEELTLLDASGNVQATYLVP